MPGLKDRLIRQTESKKDEERVKRETAFQNSLEQKANPNADIDLSPKEDITQPPEPEESNDDLFTADDLADDIFGGGGNETPVPEPQPVTPEPEPEPMPAPAPEPVNEFTGEDNTNQDYNDIMERVGGNPLSQNDIGNEGNEEDRILGDSLLGLAKQTIMLDVREQFESKLLSKEAMTEIINSYVSDKKFSYENRDQILVSLIQEVMRSDYTNNHYDQYVNDIFSSIMRDLDN